MLGLPKNTEFNRRISKQKFYEHLAVSPTLKRSFVEQIRVIWWRNKISSTTINLAAGDVVREIEVFEVCLSAPELDKAVLRKIDKEISYHILFLLEYDGKYQAWTAYKEAADSGANAFKVGRYYYTDWMEESALPLKLDGLNTDQVYENFVRQIAGESLLGVGKTLKESVERDTRRQELQKQIAVLQEQVRREKQLNKQVQLNMKLKELKGDLEEICN